MQHLSLIASSYIASHFTNNIKQEAICVLNAVEIANAPSSCLSEVLFLLAARLNLLKAVKKRKEKEWLPSSRAGLFGSEWETLVD